MTVGTPNSQSVLSEKALRQPAAIVRGTDWAGVADRWRRPRGRAFSWRWMLWGLLLPERRQRTLPTLPGMVLIALALAVGSAAYNTGSNILFITLSLLLASLVLSGVWSWLNFARTEWRLVAPPAFRVGQEAVVAVELRNRKRVLPAYALWFDLEVPLARLRHRMHLRERLGAGGERRLEWTFHPPRRGVERLRIEGVGSLFPFGFLRKTAGAGVEQTVRVWPARVTYRFAGAVPARQQWSSEEVPRVGRGSDLLGLRRYQPGDSHRHIHWKASARQRQLLVRQNAAESAQMFSLHVNTGATRWTRPEQFELLCRLAGTLAEDLFRAGRLDTVTVDNEPLLEIRRLRDVETFLDRLAELAPAPAGPTGPPARPRTATITFEPDGERGICARLGGDIAARA